MSKFECENPREVIVLNPQVDAEISKLSEKLNKACERIIYGWLKNRKKLPEALERRPLLSTRLGVCEVCRILPETDTALAFRVNEIGVEPLEIGRYDDFVDEQFPVG